MNLQTLKSTVQEEVKAFNLTDLKVLVDTLNITVNGNKKLKKTWVDAVVDYKVNLLSKTKSPEKQFIAKNDGKIYLSDAEKESQLKYDVLRTIQEIADERNYVAIFDIVEALPCYSLTQIHSALQLGERENIYELSAVAEPMHYTEQQLDCGIQIRNSLFLFVSLNNESSITETTEYDWSNY